MRFQAGACYNVHFYNALDYEGEEKDALPRSFSSPNHPLRLGQNQYEQAKNGTLLMSWNESNLHFHGLHVSGEFPSDDPTIVVPPGQHITFRLDIPVDHMPGTHWYHPHRHLTTTLQVGGGAVGAVIVQEPPAYFGDHDVLTHAPEIVFLAHPLNFAVLHDVAVVAGEGLWSVSGTGPPNHRIVIVNGRVLPTFRLEPGQWTRVRIIWAS